MVIESYDEPVGKPERNRQPENPPKERSDRPGDPGRGRAGRESEKDDPKTGRRRTPKPHEDGVPVN